MKQALLWLLLLATLLAASTAVAQDTGGRQHDEQHSITSGGSGTEPTQEELQSVVSDAEMSTVDQRSVSGEDVKNMVNGVLQSLANTVSGLQSGLLGSLKNKVDGVKAGLLNGLKKQVGDAKDLLNSLKNILKGDNKRSVVDVLSTEELNDKKWFSRRGIIYEGLTKKMDKLIEELKKNKIGGKHGFFGGKRDLLNFEDLGGKLDQLIELLKKYAKQNLNLIGKRDVVEKRGVFQELGNKLDLLIEKVDGYLRNHTTLGKKRQLDFNFQPFLGLKNGLEDLKELYQEILDIIEGDHKRSAPSAEDLNKLQKELEELKKLLKKDHKRSVPKLEDLKLLEQLLRDLKKHFQVDDKRKTDLDKLDKVIEDLKKQLKNDQSDLGGVQTSTVDRRSVSGEDVKNVVNGVLQSLANKVSGLQSGLLGSLKNKVDGVTAGLLNGLKKQVGDAKDLLNSLKNILKGDNKRSVVDVLSPEEKDEDLISKRGLKEFYAKKMHKLAQFLKHNKLHGVLGRKRSNEDAESKRDLLNFEDLGGKLDQLIALLKKYAKQNLNLIGKRDVVEKRGVFQELGNKLDLLIEKVDGYLRNHTTLGKKRQLDFNFQPFLELKNGLEDLKQLYQEILDIIEGDKKRSAPSAEDLNKLKKELEDLKKLLKKDQKRSALMSDYHEELTKAGSALLKNYFNKGERNKNMHKLKDLLKDVLSNHFHKKGKK